MSEFIVTKVRRELSADSSHRHLEGVITGADNHRNRQFVANSIKAWEGLEDERRGYSLAYAKAVISRDTTDTGLLVTREGQRGAWIPLPHDSLGSVLDVADAGPRLAAVLQLLVGIEVPLPERFAVAAKLGPTMMLTVGNSDVIGRRTSASMSGFGSDEDIALQPDDSVDAASVLRFVDEIAEEVLARLVAGIKRR